MAQSKNTRRSVVVLVAWATLAAINVPGCLSADDGHPLSGGTGACVMWRQTSDCVSSGPREPQNDKSCTTPVDAGASGYCDCAGGRSIGFDCGHGVITCSAVCGGGSGPAPDGGGGSGPVADGGGGGSLGAFIRGIFSTRKEITDPCALAGDGDVCGDVLGPPAEPGALYSCRAHSTEAITS